MPSRFPTLWPWGLAALVFVYGLHGQNTAAVLLAQIVWVAQLIAGSQPVWRWLPSAAVVLAATYVAVGEVAWLASAVGLEGSVLIGRVSVELISASSAIAPWLFERSRPRLVLSSSKPSVAVAIALIAVLWPALRPGNRIGTAEFILPAVDLMHNMSRAAFVQDVGYIPYGTASPVGALSGDYYPRGFHLVAAYFGDLFVGTPAGDTELWALDFARLYWLVWAMLIVALSTWAVTLQEARTGSRLKPLTFVALASPVVFLLPPVFRGIVSPGFPAFALGILALVVALSHLSTTAGAAAVISASAASVVVISHSWQALLPILGFAAVAWVLGDWRRRLFCLRSTESLSVLVLGLLLCLRPLISTIASADAANQAREAGSIAAIPSVVLAACAAGYAIWLVAPMSRRHRTVIGAALVAAIALESTALVATGGDWDLYYPRKVAWAALIVLLPPLSVVLLQVLAGLGKLVLRRRDPRLIDSLALACLLPAAATVTHNTVIGMVANRPVLEARLASLAHEALSQDAAQVVAHKYLTEESDYAANMWGRGALELQGTPAHDFSEVQIGDLTLSEICRSSDLQRPLLVHSGEVPGASPVMCGATP